MENLFTTILKKTKKEKKKTSSPETGGCVTTVWVQADY